MRGFAVILFSILMAVPTAAQGAPQKKPATAAVQAKQKPPAAGAKKAAAAPARKVRNARSARAKSAKAKGSPKTNPAVVAAYAAMPVAERRAIQSDLIWTGDYTGVISDEFSERPIAAVKSYQARSGGAETGILSLEQRATLAAAAKRKQEASGWRVVDDAVTGARLAVPIKHALHVGANKSGTRWSSGRGEVQIETFRIAEPDTTLAAVFEQQKKEPATRQVEYSVLRETFFVLAGLQGLKRFYVRAHVKENDVRGVLIMYDQAMQGIMDPVAIAMSSRFEPFPSAPSGPPGKRKVEYATGVVVDELGHVITDRQVVDGCQVITLAGLGNAERVAEAADVALLRVYGARNLVPVATAETFNGSDVKLVGIADPEIQGGNGAATTIAARLVSRESTRDALDPAPALGFSGAAALDPHGRLAGMAQLTTAVVAGRTDVVAQARLVPIEAIKALLNGRDIAPAVAALPSAEAAKASVVRVICVRK